MTLFDRLLAASELLCRGSNLQSEAAASRSNVPVAEHPKVIMWWLESNAECSHLYASALYVHLYRCRLCQIFFEQN